MRVTACQNCKGTKIDPITQTTCLDCLDGFKQYSNATEAIMHKLNSLQDQLDHCIGMVSTLKFRNDVLIKAVNEELPADDPLWEEIQQWVLETHS